jgi:hypothetical protein
MPLASQLYLLVLGSLRLLSPPYNSLLASWNWPSLPLWMIHFAVVAALLGSEAGSLSLVPLRHWRRSVSSWQCSSRYSGSNHASVPYIIVGQNTELYNSLALAKDAPHVEVMTCFRAAIAATPFWPTIFAWALYLSLGSSYTPSTRTLLVGAISILSSLTLAASCASYALL